MEEVTGEGHFSLHVEVCADAKAHTRQVQGHAMRKAHVFFFFTIGIVGKVREKVLWSVFRSWVVVLDKHSYL